MTRVDLRGMRRLRRTATSFLGSCAQLRLLNLSGLPCLIVLHVCASCPNLTSVNLSHLRALRAVGAGAFAKCTALTSANLRGLHRLQTLGDSFMSKCHMLASIDLSSMTALRTVGALACNDCIALTAANLKGLGHVEALGSCFFANCDSLSAIDLSGMHALQRIGECAFVRCAALTSVNLSCLAHVEEIGNGFLRKCKALPAIDLTGMKALRRIGMLAFSSCDAPPRNTNCSAIGHAVDCDAAQVCLADYFLCVDDTAATLLDGAMLRNAERDTASAAAAAAAAKGAPLPPPDLHHAASPFCLAWAAKLVAASPPSDDPTIPSDGGVDRYAHCQQTLCTVLTDTVFPRSSPLDGNDNGDESTEPSPTTANARLVDYLANCLNPPNGPPAEDGGAAEGPPNASLAETFSVLIEDLAHALCPFALMTGGGDGFLPPNTGKHVFPWLDTALCEATAATGKTGSFYPADGYIFTDAFPAAAVLKKCPALSKCAWSCFDLVTPTARTTETNETDVSIAAASSSSSVPPTPSDTTCHTFGEDCLTATSACILKIAANSADAASGGGGGGGGGARPGGAGIADPDALGNASAASGESQPQEEEEAEADADAAFCAKWTTHVQEMGRTVQRQHTALTTTATTACARAACAVLNIVSGHQCLPTSTGWTAVCIQGIAALAPTEGDLPVPGGDLPLPLPQETNMSQGSGSGGDGIQMRPNGPVPGPKEPIPSGPKASPPIAEGPSLMEPCPVYGGVMYYSTDQLFQLDCPNVTACLATLCGCVGGQLGRTGCVFAPAEPLRCDLAPACLSQGYACIRQEAARASSSSSSSSSSADRCRTWGATLLQGIATADVAAASGTRRYADTDVFHSCRRDACGMLQQFVLASSNSSSNTTSTANLDRCRAAIVPNASWAAMCTSDASSAKRIAIAPLPIDRHTAVKQLNFTLSFPGNFDAPLAQIGGNRAAYQQLQQALEQGLTTLIGTPCRVARIFRGSLMAAFTTVIAEADVVAETGILQNAAVLATSTETRSAFAAASAVVASLGGPPQLVSPVVSSPTVSMIESYQLPVASSASASAFASALLSRGAAVVMLVAVAFFVLV